ncbi:MAG: HAD family hydrolase [Alphaproteobacteria bacterium]
MVQLPEAIFFDWDGTLVDSYEFLKGAHDHVRQTLGLPPFQGDEFRNYFGHPREKLYTELYGDHIESAKTLFGDYVVKNHVAQLKPMPGADQMLKICEGLGFTLGVISNKKAEYLHLEIKSLGWEGRFVTVMGAGDAAQDKPAPDPLLKAVASCGGIPMERVWYVGDTDVDLKCAQSAGCASIFIAHHDKSEEWIKLYKPLLIFKDCRGLGDFLLQTTQNKLKTKDV